MATIPSGVVTFLFSDIEGSTSHWEQHPGAMRLAFARQEEIVRQAASEHGGYTYKMIGDAFQIAFQTAGAALAAALAAQRALASEPWGELGALRVRMALHTGSVEERGDDYVGPLLNRLARLLVAGHGGQILLSGVTREVLGERLPARVALRDLGMHHLKDLIQPERIFQAIAPGLPAEFPPLKTLDTHPNNLPAQPNALIGRAQDVMAARALLDRADIRLLTLVGPGGTGKTRLALQIAADLLHQFDDGVWFVDLATISDPAIVTPAIAYAVGLKDAAGQTPADSLKAYLRHKQVLIVLDNCEQVAEAAPLLSELMQSAPRLKLLLTSRVALRLYGEREYPVPPLALPAPHRQARADQLARYAAIELFVERAQSVRPDFAIADDNAAAIAEICTRLDGLPLAIELAAARTRLFTPAALLDRLRQHGGAVFQLLSTTTVSRTARQQTLRGAIEWSYDLLTAAEQALFRRLGVFVGGWTLDAAEAVCDFGMAGAGLIQTPVSEIQKVLDGLASLVEKSLVRQSAAPDGEPRFTMLETIRAYAQERLASGGEREQIQQRYLRYFTELAEDAEPHVQGAQQAAWLDRLEREHDNLRAALQWALDGRNAEMALRLSAALGEFWWPRGYVREGRAWLSGALALGGAPAARARALYRAGELAYAERDAAEASALLEQALAIYRAVGDRWGIARVLRGLGNVEALHGNAARAHALYEEGLALFREIGDSWGVAWLLLEIGRARADPIQQTALLNESLALARAGGYKRTIATALGNLGKLAHAQGEYARAAQLLEEALAIGRELRDHWLTTWPLTLLAMVACDQRDVARATALFTECLNVHQASEYRRGIYDMLSQLGHLARWQADYDRAEAYYRESMALAEEIGDAHHRAIILCSLGYLAQVRRDGARAGKCLRESLALYRAQAHAPGIAECVIGLASVAVDRRQPGRAARLLGFAQALRESLGEDEVFMTPANREVYERILRATRAMLAPDAFQEARAAGHALALDQGIALALDDAPPNHS